MKDNEEKSANYVTLLGIALLYVGRVQTRTIAIFSKIFTPGKSLEL